MCKMQIFFKQKYVYSDENQNGGNIILKTDAQTKNRMRMTFAVCSPSASQLHP